MAYKKGKPEGIKAKLEGYQKLEKKDIVPGEGILIDNIIKGTSAEYGDFVYVTGSYQAKPVFVTIPAASLPDFWQIEADDIQTIRENGEKLYIESQHSKNGRDYFIAWIDG